MLRIRAVAVTIFLLAGVVVVDTDDDLAPLPLQMRRLPQPQFLGNGRSLA